MTKVMTKVMKKKVMKMMKMKTQTTSVTRGATGLGQSVWQ
jgi:hypothetical protein